MCNKKEKAFKLAKQYGIENQLIVPGFEQNPYNWIKQAKALVLSSDFEGLPTVLIEAIAIGTPVVSTNCNFGPNEILTEELSKYLVPTEQSDLLAKAIEDVLIDSPDMKKATILKKVSADAVADQYLAMAR